MTDLFLALIALCLFPTGMMAWMNFINVIRDDWRYYQEHKQ